MLSSLQARARLIAHLQAAQYADVAELSAHYPAAHEFLATEIALALSCTESSAQAMLAAAEAFRDRLPAHPCRPVGGDDRRGEGPRDPRRNHFHRRGCGRNGRGSGAARRRQVTARTVRRRADRAVITCDPDGAHDRHQRRIRDRYVSRWAETDGMAGLRIYSAAQDIATIYEAVTALADIDRIPGDDRDLGNRRVDALVDICTDVLAGGWQHAGLPARQPRRNRPQIRVTMPLNALLGGDDPCELDGHGADNRPAGSRDRRRRRAEAPGLRPAVRNPARLRPDPLRAAGDVEGVRQGPRPNLRNARLRRARRPRRHRPRHPGPAGPPHRTPDPWAHQRRQLGDGMPPPSPRQGRRWRLRPGQREPTGALPGPPRWAAPTVGNPATLVPTPRRPTTRHAQNCPSDATSQPGPRPPPSAGDPPAPLNRRRIAVAAVAPRLPRARSCQCSDGTDSTSREVSRWADRTQRPFDRNAGRHGTCRPCQTSDSRCSQRTRPPRCPPAPRARTPGAVGDRP